MFYDGAQHAFLQITYKGNVYKLNASDHDESPKEIRSLVTHIVSLAETVE